MTDSEASAAAAATAAATATATATATAADTTAEVDAMTTKVIKSIEVVTEEAIQFEKSTESVSKKLLSAVTTSIPKELEVSDKIYHIVKDDLRGFDVDVSNLIVLVTKVVEICDRFKTLDGESRKKIGIEVINKLLSEDLSITDETELSYIEMTVDNLIETVLQSSKGHLKLNLKAKKKNPVLANTPPSLIIDSLLDKLKTIIKNNQYTPNTLLVNIPVMVGMIMGIVEEYPNLNGVQKKNIIIQIMKRLIREVVPTLMELDEEQTKKLELALNTIGDTIDLLVLVGKNKIDINPEKIRRLFCCCH